MSDNVIVIFVVGIVFIVIILLCVLAYMYIKEKMQKNKENDEIDEKAKEIDERKAQKSIFEFMEFDSVEDNMIVQDGGKRYLMVIECKDVNYDLLSNVEKNSIEQGFISFLNTFKYEIQIYVQTRKVNLMQSTMKYRERLKVIENDMHEEEHKYNMLQRKSDVSRQELMKAYKEVTKKRNLYEYALDVIENTEQMSSDSDLTTKSYYIIVPYYTDEITSVGDYDKKEISTMAFSELYTRAQALVSALNECDVRGRIMTSQEIVELLFVAYNREQHDLYDFDEYMTQSGYNTFYSVSQDVLEKRAQVLDEEIVKKANERVVDAYQRASKKTRELRKRIEDREKRMSEYVDALAGNIIEAEQVNIGRVMVDRTKDEIKQMREEDDEKKEKREGKNKESQNNNKESQNNNSENKVDEDLINRVLKNMTMSNDEDEEETSAEETTSQSEASSGEANNSEESKPKKKKKLSEMTEEEILRRKRLLKKKRLLKEREARANANAKNEE